MLYSFRIVYVENKFNKFITRKCFSILTMIRSRFVGWGGGVFGGRGICIVVGFPAVSDLSNVARVAIVRVSHSLGTAIGQENVVRSASGIPIAGFILTKVKSSIVILDGIVVVVSRVGVFVFGFMVGWGGFVRGGRLVGWGGAISQGNSGQAKNNENLKND